MPCLQISHDQQFEDDMYVCWFYEPPAGFTTYLYAFGALAAIFALVLFPLWPSALRRGIWYLSMACLGVMGMFFGIALIRLVLFAITYLVLVPGLWIFPNLFEDVSVVQSFLPLWAWSGEDTMKKHRRQNKKKISKKMRQVKELKIQKEEEYKKNKQEADNELQTVFETINATIKAVEEEREKAGNPMSPTEIAQFGQKLFDEMLNFTRKDPDINKRDHSSINKSEKSSNLEVVMEESESDS